MALVCDLDAGMELLSIELVQGFVVGQQGRYVPILSFQFAMRGGASYSLLGTVKADSHIACRSHAVLLPCRAAKGLEWVFPI